MKLTKKVIEKLPAAGTAQQFYRDQELPGFAVRVTARGYKSYVFERRIKGKVRRITIARVGDVTPEVARKRAEALAGEIALGGDPRDRQKREQVESLALRQVVDAYLQHRHLKPRTTKDIDQALKGIEDWKGKPIREITPEMVRERHTRLGQRSKARANLTMRYLRAVLNFARAEYTTPDGEPILARNPVERLSSTKSWFKVARRHTVIKPHDLGAWVRAVLSLDEPPPRAPGEGKQRQKLHNGEAMRDYFMLVLLTGLRRQEAMDLRWGDIDWNAKTLTVTDTKAGRPHTLPLSDYLFTMLERRRNKKADEGVFVFSDASGRRLSNLRYAQARVTELSGVPFTVHDLRRTFATVAESLDVPAYALKRLLNHSTGADVTAGYLIVDSERLRKPMQRITDFVLKNAGVKSSAEVVVLKNVAQEHPA